MLRISRRLAVLMLLAALGAAGFPAIAQESGAGAQRAEPAANVLLTVRIGQIEKGKRIEVKSYALVMVDGELAGSRMLSGARIPFPTAQISEDDADGEMTQFVYQNVGFSAQARAWILTDGKIKLVANIEDSRVEPGEGDAPPSVETRELSINAVLTSGKPMEVARVEGIRDQSGFVEVEATIQR